MLNALRCPSFWPLNPNLGGLLFFSSHVDLFWPPRFALHGYIPYGPVKMFRLISVVLFNRLLKESLKLKVIFSQSSMSEYLLPVLNYLNAFYHEKSLFFRMWCYLLVAVGLSGILKGKQKLAVTFNFDKQDVIDFTKFSKMGCFFISKLKEI